MIVRDVRLGIRGLLKAPGFTTVVILTLAVAIGANTAIFSVLDAVLLRSLPYPEPDRIVRVAATTRPELGGDGFAPFSDRGYWHFVENNRSFEKFGGYLDQLQYVPLTGDGPAIQVAVSLMTLSAFEILGVRPARGRFPTAQEDLPGGPEVVLLSHDLWVSRYGSDPDILHRTILVNGRAREVIGIMPPEYDFPSPETNLWFPRRLNPGSENFGGHHITGIARLADGVAIESAVADAEALVVRFDEVGYGPSWFTGVFDGGAAVWTLKEDIVGDIRQPLLILIGTVGFVLLIACSNIANLLLVRVEGRSRESAIRLALGSGRGRLVRKTLVEGILLALVGGLVGILLAWTGVRVLVAVGPTSIPRLGEIGIQGTVLAFTAAISVLAGILFGLLPALRQGFRSSYSSLQDGGRGTTIGRERHRTRGVLVVTQVALALVLLVGSGLMLHSFAELRNVELGFDAERTLTFTVSPLPTKYESPEAVAQFYDRLRERLEAVPGVSAVGAINTLPLTGGGAVLTTIIEEFPPEEDEFPPTFLVRRATPGYFESMGVPVVEGRTFVPDDHNLRMGSVVISNSVKEEYWPHSSALGKRIVVAGIPTQVVGVVGDLHDTSLETPAEQFMYLPMLDSIGGGVGPMTMTVGTPLEPLSLVPAIRSLIGEMDPDLAITEVRSMEEVLADSMSRTTFTMTLLFLAAIIALFLGSIGIYGVVSYTVTQRTAEIGVRMALGADPGTIRGLALLQGMRLAVVGVVIGLAVAVGMGRVIESLLFGVSPLDPYSLVGGSTTFIVVAALATLVPAHRAACISPAVSLREE